tara:strand:- start:2120 stop:2455 length:336 start_codon:yes stop_codon:yes gene_type:complete
VALVVPDEEVLLAWAATQPALAKKSLADLCADQTVRDMVFKDIVQGLHEAKLNGFEIPKAVVLIPEPFSIENDLLTPTMKLKRQVARDHFQPLIAAMYESVKKGAPTPSKL